MRHTALMLAVMMERIGSELLLDFGADPNLQNIEGRTALHLLPERQPIA
jgi:ankyrin repeat protein